MENIRTFNFKDQWDETFKIAFYRSKYESNGRVYVGCMCQQDEENPDFWETYCDITANLPDSIPDESYAFLDANNGDKLVFKFMEEQGWMTQTGLICSSGFCNYPLVKFSDEFLNKICKELTEE